MARSWTWLTFGTSSLLRLFCYVFFRWIPGHPFPPLISTVAAIYFVSFFYTLTSPDKVIADEVKSFTKSINQDDESEPDRSNAPEEHDEEDMPSHPILTLVTGLPSPTSMIWTGLTFGLNLLLVLGMLDLTYRSALLYPAHDLSFTRLGFISDTSAKILIREPDHQQLPIHVSYRHADHPVSGNSRQLFDSAWKHVSEIRELTEDTDFTTIAYLQHLQPDTRYQYAFSNNKTGYLVTAPRPGHFTQRHPSSPRSADAATSGTFSFLHSSCILPNFPYSGPFNHPLQIPGLAYLPKILFIVRPAFMLFLGDFIYIDVPRRHGEDIATYRREYRQVYASPDWPKAATVPSATYEAPYDAYDLPWLHVYDDHEIANDWSANTSGVYPAAFDPYTHYHISGNPPPRSVPNLYTAAHTTQPSDETFTTFIYGPASFFLADTRRHRSAPSRPDSTLLGADQLAYLLKWLATPPAPGIRWKILITSVPFTRNWRINSADTWAGYLSERRTILEAMWTVNADSTTGQDGVGVVILSGDRHEHATTAFLPPEGDERWNADTAPVVEFSTSPASMFYLPFRSYREDEVTASTRGALPLPSILPEDDTPTLEDELSSVQQLQNTSQSPGQERDKCLYYHPSGNSKYGAVTIESATGSGQSLLRYRLFVDGEEVWSHVLVGPERRSGGKGWGRTREGEGTWI